MASKLFLLAILCIGSLTFAYELPAASDVEIFDLFKAWQLEHGISYASLDEELYRFENFKSTYQFIQDYNSQGNSAVLGLNEFSAYSQEEQHAMFGSGFKLPEVLPTNVPVFESDIDINALPTTWDWRQKGVVSPVVSEGTCGSTWAFSAVWSIESFWAIKNNDNLTPLSVGQVNQCDTKSDGCSGGYPINAFAYVKNYGLETAADYPYKPNDDKCDYNASEAIQVLNSYAAIPANSPNLMQAAVYKTPISVNVNGTSAAFVYYKSGILDQDCGDGQPTTCLTVVGWDVVNNTNVWIAKNMFGTSWGMEGYAYIAMDATINRGSGACVIYSGPITPLT